MEVWPDEAARYFRPGELIRVYTFDGTIYEFKLVDITATAIVGKRQQIPFDDIAKLERRF
jgi:hypothetical protein